MVAWLIYWGRKWVEKSHASYFLERRCAAQNKLHAKAPFPVRQNLFWQVCGSIIIDCQISINDLISVCVRACVCVYRARGHLVQQQRGRRQRMCSYKTDP